MTAKYKSKRDWDRLTMLIPGYDPHKGAELFYFDEQKADRACDFIQTYCRHCKGDLAGELLHLEDWQLAVIGNLFGWQTRDTQIRRYTKTLWYLPRKNGKSFLAACVALYILLADRQKAPEIVVAAGNRKQAKLIWGVCEKMIKQDRELKKKTKIYTASSSITAPNTFGKLDAISKESGTAHGENLSCAIMDELHVFKGYALVEALETSQGTRAEPLRVYTTTADYGGRESVCSTKHRYFEQVRDGIIEDERALPVIYSLGKDEDWEDPEVWRRVNPNLDVAIPMSYLEDEYKEAKLSKVKEISFRRLYLNEQVGAAEMFFDLDKWEACGSNNLKLEDLVGETCYMALDLSSTLDLTAASMYFPEQHALFVKCFCPEEGVQVRSEKDGVMYENYVGAGHLIPTPGNVVDYDYIKMYLVKLAEDYHIAAIGFDPWHAEKLVLELEDEGFDMIKIPQNLSTMNPALQQFERAILGNKIVHTNNPLLTWNVMNMVVRMDASGFVRPDKKKSAEKIDAIVACIMAYYLSIRHQEEEVVESYTANHGLMIL